jgi:hypothetical protein
LELLTALLFALLSPTKTAMVHRAPWSPPDNDPLTENKERRPNEKAEGARVF